MQFFAPALLTKKYGRLGSRKLLHRVQNWIVFWLIQSLGVFSFRISRLEESLHTHSKAHGPLSRNQYVFIVRLWPVPKELEISKQMIMELPTLARGHYVFFQDFP